MLFFWLITLLLLFTFGVPKSTRIFEQGVPQEPTDVKVIKLPKGAEIRYREPGLCETTPGVKSYSGYISLNATTNMFFWFFEARENPQDAPITLWLNGGPGADSLLGLFQGNGPCSIDKDLKEIYNKYSWNNYSNMLYLSQPLGVGFSYQKKNLGCYDKETKKWKDCPHPNGRRADIDPYAYDTAEKAAVTAWDVVQAFFTGLPKLSSKVSTDAEFHMWGESYAGHYIPVFYRYFYDRNRAIAYGTAKGTQVKLGTLGIISGLIDAKIQSKWYYEFPVNNTYGIKAVNDTIYTFMKQAYELPNGCRDAIDACEEADRETQHGRLLCSTALSICRGLVRGPYDSFSGRSVYDIRCRTPCPDRPATLIPYLNRAHTQRALGVDLNYTTAENSIVARGLGDSGDFAYPLFRGALQDVLDAGARAVLVHGDADFTCNWRGGEEVVRSLRWGGGREGLWRVAALEDVVVGEGMGKERQRKGTVREGGGVAFVTVDASGHQVAFFQSEVAQTLFRRSVEGKRVADGGRL
ncbi:peptidase S10, serine carboxypeptidase [Phyllosticta paracitricarpa]|uniref:Carboxypeptidase n=2 Tax=Phyllosticta TaxID=121621 RepID=A0ABR1MP78_9PEZI